MINNAKWELAACFSSSLPLHCFFLKSAVDYGAQFDVKGVVFAIVL